MIMANNAEAEAPATTANNGPIVHIREDSNKSLDEMFAIVNKPPGVQRQLQVPLRMRKLPQSFFNPPSHSRENSVDNTLSGAGPATPGQGDPFSPAGSSTGSVGSPQPAGAPQPAPFHVRTHSSPANLQQNLSLATSTSTDPPQPLHIRQGSCDDKMGPLPPGWEMAKDNNGQTYFMNHITKTTQWEDPRKQMLAQQQAQQQAVQAQQQQQLQLQQQQQQQQLGGIRGGPSPQPIHQRSNSASSVFGAANNSANLGPLPEGWEESTSADGQTYFIDHINKNTTWFDPRIPAGSQRLPIRPNNVNPNPPTQADFQAQQRRQQEARLQKLENERKALQLRQVELRRQMEQQQRQRSMSTENVQAAMHQTQEMLMRQSLGDAPAGDPFLGGGGQAGGQSAQEQHNRQESADSGVGMGSNFNLMRIPEDMDMDTSSAMDTTLTNENVDCSSSATSSTVAPSSTTAGGNMDASDGLMPNLPAELGEVLSSDIMDGVLSINNRTEASWL